jgi:dihydrofolate reductase
MAAYWPTAPADEIADKMNRLPKIVFSKSLQRVDWNNSRLIRNDAQEEISRWRQKPGKDIVILGSAKLASSLLPLGLIDEYRVILNPILMGGGKPLFTGIPERIRLQLRATRVFASGVVLLSYQKV